MFSVSPSMVRVAARKVAIAAASLCRLPLSDCASATGMAVRPAIAVATMPSAWDRLSWSRVAMKFSTRPVAPLTEARISAEWLAESTARTMPRRP
ncbi:hypothetical protein D3C80_1920480 [compost metagenome]